MARCKKCGKEIKGMAAHMRRMHGAPPAEPQQQVGKRGGRPIGSIGRNLALQEDRPLEADLQRRLLLKGRAKPPCEVTLYNGRPIYWKPLMEDRYS